MFDRAKCDKSDCKLVVYDVSLHNRHIILTFAEKRQVQVQRQRTLHREIFLWLRTVRLSQLDGKQMEINIYSQLFSHYSLKNKFAKCNSTLPPPECYHFEYQHVRQGGISGGIRVELHEVPP